MEAANHILYVLFSIVNFILCALAVYRMYNYLRPELILPAFFKRCAQGWICALMIFAVSQLNIIVVGDTGTAWTLKMGVFIFALVSCNFGKISSYIKESM